MFNHHICHTMLRFDSGIQFIIDKKNVVSILIPVRFTFRVNDEYDFQV